MAQVRAGVQRGHAARGGAAAAGARVGRVRGAAARRRRVGGARRRAAGRAARRLPAGRGLPQALLPGRRRARRRRPRALRPGARRGTRLHLIDHSLALKFMQICMHITYFSIIRDNGTDEYFCKISLSLRLI